MWIIAEVPSPISEYGIPLFNSGIGVYLVYWLTAKMVPEMRRMSDALNAASRVQLMQLLVHPRFPEEAKQAAQQTLDDLPKP